MLRGYVERDATSSTEINRQVDRLNGSTNMTTYGPIGCNADGLANARGSENWSGGDTMRA